MSLACSNPSPWDQASITAESMRPRARIFPALPGLSSPSSPAASSIRRQSSPRYTPAVFFSKNFIPGLLLALSSSRSKSPSSMPSYMPDSRLISMPCSPLSPSFSIIRRGTEVQVLVPVPLIWPIKPL